MNAKQSAALKLYIAERPPLKVDAIHRLMVDEHGHPSTDPARLELMIELAKAVRRSCGGRTLDSAMNLFDAMTNKRIRKGESDEP